MQGYVKGYTTKGSACMCLMVPITLSIIIIFNHGKNIVVLRNDISSMLEWNIFSNITKIYCLHSAVDGIRHVMV